MGLPSHHSGAHHIPGCTAVPEREGTVEPWGRGRGTCRLAIGKGWALDISHWKRAGHLYISIGKGGGICRSLSKHHDVVN